MPQHSELPTTSSGELWSADEDEKLRLLYLSLCKEMVPRSPAAVFARICILRDRRHYKWPEIGE